jgi:hypothetical protein
MMQRCSLLVVIATLFFLGNNCQAFTVPRTFGSPRVITALNNQIPKNANSDDDASLSRQVAAMTTALATTAMVVLPVWAETATDDYEYGAVNAPIGIAWAVGVLAILTALLPLALRGGEEAFEEIKERDKETFNKSPDSLKKRK